MSKIDALRQRKLILGQDIAKLEKEINQIQSKCKHTGKKVFHPSNGPYIDGYRECANCGKVV